MPTFCQNCGTAVSKTYVRVRCPDGVENPRCCPACPDQIRRGGRIESTDRIRHDARAVDYEPG